MAVVLGHRRRRVVIMPLAIAALVSGLVSSLGTRWGLFRHYWVLIKLVLTVVATAVLLVQLAPIAELARVAADLSAPIREHPEAKRSLIHAAGGLVVLLIVQVLGMYKPKGMTRYGWRMEREGKNDAEASAP